jgi:hypothetical protein
LEWGTVGAGHLLGVLSGEQSRIVPADRQPSRPIAESSRHSIEEPRLCAVEGLRRRMLVAQQGHFVVLEERGDEGGPSLVGVLGDAAHQREGVHRRGHDNLLAGDERKANLHSKFGQPVKPLLVGAEGRRGACTFIYLANGD